MRSARHPLSRGGVAGYLLPTGYLKDHKPRPQRDVSVLHTRCEAQATQSTPNSPVHVHTVPDRLLRRSERSQLTHELGEVHTTTQRKRLVPAPQQLQLLRGSVHALVDESAPHVFQ